MFEYRMDGAVEGGDLGEVDDMRGVNDARGVARVVDGGETEEGWSGADESAVGNIAGG